MCVVARMSTTNPNGDHQFSVTIPQRAREYEAPASKDRPDPRAGDLDGDLMKPRG